MIRRVFFLGLICLVVSGLTSCDKKDKAKEISFEKREVVSLKTPKDEALLIAVGGMIIPREGLAYYQEFLRYIGDKLSRPVKFVDREDYGEINELLRLGDIDIAFVCGGPYVTGHDEFGMELLVAPQAYGESVYYSYIIVAKDSTVRSFDELRGKKFAFADPLSNTGRVVPTYMLAKRGETPESYFKNYVYTYAHDKSIKAVAQGIVDGAAVDSLIWEYANRTNSETALKTKVVEKSPPHGIPPVVVRPGIDPELKEQLRLIFLNSHKDEKGRQILKKMMIDKFVAIDDAAYDSIREMQSWIIKQKKKEEIQK